MSKPCLDCGRITRGSRCTSCEAKRQHRRNQIRAHYQGDYRARAKRVRDEAQACWLCGQGPRDGDPWTADHVVPTDPASPLMAAHRSCNSARGGRMNRR